jgi:hypothetical protein
MRKPAVQVRNDMKDEVARRLSDGESLRSIARSIGCCYQTLQYWREKWGLPKLKPTQFYGKDHPNWKGGVSIDRQGYRLVYSPGRTRKVHPYSYEHVLVAEAAIGRRLNKGEHVHHIDGDKLNNSPTNLLVLTDAEHKHVHWQLGEVAFDLFRRGLIVFADGKYRSTI